MSQLGLVSGGVIGVMPIAGLGQTPGLAPYPPTVASTDPTVQANLWLDEMLRAPYDNYKVRIFYAYEEGYIRLPVAGVGITPAVGGSSPAEGSLGAPAEIARLTSPHGVKVVAFAGRRTGNKPYLPQREADTDNQVFSRESIMMETAELEADGLTWVYVFAGMYVYELRRPLSPNNGDALSYGQPPYASGRAANNTLTQADMAQAITVSSPDPSIPLSGRVAPDPQNPSSPPPPPPPDMLGITSPDLLGITSG